MYLLVRNDGRIEQIVKQLQKLYDVLNVALREDYDHTLFNRLHEFIKGKG